MAGFLEALEETRRERVSPARVKIEALKPEDREAFFAALNDETISVERISAALRRLDVEIGVSTLRRWRAVK